MAILWACLVWGTGRGGGIRKMGASSECLKGLSLGLYCMQDFRREGAFKDCLKGHFVVFVLYEGLLVGGGTGSFHQICPGLCLVDGTWLSSDSW